MGKERWYKQLLIEVLGRLLERRSIRTGKFARSLIDLINGKLDYEKLIGSEKFDLYAARPWGGPALRKPQSSLFNLLGGNFAFAIAGNLKNTLASGNKKKIANLFESLLFSPPPLSARINDFQNGFNELYKVAFRAKRLGNAPKAPRMPLNLISVFLACAHPDKLYFYKSAN